MWFSFQIKKEKCIESGMTTEIAALTHNVPAQIYKFYPEGNSLMCLE